MTLSTQPTQRDHSLASKIVEELRTLGEEGAARFIKTACRKFKHTELAALASNWSFWARSKQLPPKRDWRTWGFLTGRGFGKTRAVSNFVTDEAREGRAPLVCLMAQDEQNCIDVQVLGPNGLIATSPPWFRAQWEASALQVVWPNGARAYVRTPEVPGKIRGLEYQLSWICELQSWPRATMQEALDNVFLSTRLGYARIVWDATAKRRHPLLQEMLSRHAADPDLHPIVRGTTHENAANLGPGYIAEIERKFGRTARGREELLGEMLENVDGALWEQSWIDRTRRPAPDRFRRRVVSVDPAVTARAGSDTTGIVEAALGTDGQGYVIGDSSGKHKPEQWGVLVLDRYVKGECDLVVAETNKGGDLVAQNLKSLARERGLEVIVVGKDERPHRVQGKVFVKEVHARGEKGDRAAPVATAYERGRVSHVVGADLSSLEDTLTTWEPPTEGSRRDSPGDLDALVHAMVELLDLNNAAPDAVRDFTGIHKVAEQLAKPSSPAQVMQGFASVFSRADYADRI
jgi:phage terminase large subunit-like protein